MRIGPQSVRWRLTLWYALALAVTLAAFAIGSFTILGRVTDLRSDDFLASARDAFGTELVAESEEIPDFPEAVRAAQRDVYFRDVEFLIYSPRTRNWTGGRVNKPVQERSVTDSTQRYDVDRLASIVRSHTGTRSAVVRLSDGEGGYRVALRNVEISGSPYTIVALQSRRTHFELLEDIALVFSVSAPLFLFVACLGGYLLARR